MISTSVGYDGFADDDDEIFVASGACVVSSGGMMVRVVVDRIG